MELTLGRENRWHARTDDGISLVVAGTEQAPEPELETTLRDIWSRWPEVRASIEAFAAALPAGTHIPLQPPLHGGFAARSCGFDGPLSYMSISVTRPDAPSRATVTFYTGFPDGYASFEVQLLLGEPVAIEAFAS